MARGERSPDPGPERPAGESVTGELAATVTMPPIPAGALVVLVGAPASGKTEVPY